MKKVVDVITSDKKLWVDTMMTEELGLIGDEDTSPLKSALVTFVSFVVAGFMPLVAYVFSSFVQFFSQHSFLSACILTAIVLFAVGGLRQIVTNVKWYIGGIEMLLIGGASAAVAYIVGFILRIVFGIVV